MVYNFFSSYTRGNNSKYLKKFFKNLSFEIRQQKGYESGKQVNFFDLSEIELGEEWEKSIIRAQK